jgi:hypothetical protein
LFCTSSVCGGSQFSVSAPSTLRPTLRNLYILGQNINQN